MQLVIVCNRPGLIRGGVRHPQAKAYGLDAFTPAQLEEMLHEPELTLVLGTVLTAGNAVELHPALRPVPAVAELDPGRPGDGPVRVGGASLGTVSRPDLSAPLLIRSNEELLPGVAVGAAAGGPAAFAPTAHADALEVPPSGLVDLSPDGDPPASDLEPVQEMVNDLAQTGGETLQVHPATAAVVVDDTEAGQQVVHEGAGQPVVQERAPAAIRTRKAR